MRNKNQETFEIVLNAFVKAAGQNHGTDSYATGYLQSLSVELLGMIPKKYQQSFISSMIHATQNQEAEVIQKINTKETV